MVNNQEFSERLSIVINHFGLSASSFAEQIGVQRSSISHLLSGRNKPSLDFVLKVLKEFPEVSLYWLMNGTGSFPKKEVQKEQKQISKTVEKPVSSPVQPKMAPIELGATKNPIDDSQETKEIERIVVFYNDGTFKNYKP